MRDRAFQFVDLISMYRRRLHGAASPQIRLSVVLICFVLFALFQVLVGELFHFNVAKFVVFFEFVLFGLF